MYLTNKTPNNVISDQFVSCINAFTVDARAVDKTGDGKVATTIKNAAGKKINAHTENKNDGTYKVTYILPEEGLKEKFDLISN